MKKTTLLLMFLGIIGYSNTQEPSIEGKFTTCAVTQKYTIENVDCFVKIESVQIDFRVGSWRLDPFEKNVFYVDWINNTNQSINSFITVKYQYYEKNLNGNGPGLQGMGNCNISRPKTKELTGFINILPDSVGFPTQVDNGLSSFFPKKHTFSTSAQNAVKYRWTITGGTIIGCTRCSTIQVQANPGVCTITGSVQAESSCGQLSSSRRFSKAIISPSSISNISGPTYVGAYGDFKTYSVSLEPNATSYKWYFAPGSQFLGSSKSNIISVACNTNNTTATTLYVVAQNSCGQSSIKAKTITGGINPPYKNASLDQESDWAEINKVTIVNNNQHQIIALIPDYHNIKILEIYNLSGKMVNSFTPTGVENKIDTSYLSSGVYILISKGSAKQQTVKFRVN